MVSTIELPLLDANGHMAPVSQVLHPTTSHYERSLKSIYFFLERPERRLATFYHLLNFVLIVGSICLSILSTMDEYEEDTVIRGLIFYYEIALLIWFSIEYFFRVWACSFISKYKGIRGRIKFMKTFYMLVDAFVIISTLTTAILQVNNAYFTVLRITRFLQVFRILRMDRQRGDLQTIGRVVYQHRKELITCYFVGFIILFCGAYVIYICEKKTGNQSELEPGSAASNGTIDNMANGLYWAMITVTSVGYGDFSPNTYAGKMLGGLFALIGCAFFALPAGILGSGFALQVAKQKKQERYAKVRNPATIVIQNCWRNYVVRTEKYWLQGTWKKYLPLMPSKQKRPLFHHVLPGIRDFSKNQKVKDTYVSHGTDVLFKKSKPSRFLKRLNVARMRSSRTPASKSLDSSYTSPSPAMTKTPFSTSTLETISSPCKDTGVQITNNQSASQLHLEKLLQEHQDIMYSNGNQCDKNRLVASQLINRKFKGAIRFILRIKYWTAIKSFKNVRYPFVNVQDIMEKSAHRHSETLSYLKEINEQFVNFRREIRELHKEIEIMKIEKLREEERKLRELRMRSLTTAENVQVDELQTSDQAEESSRERVETESPDKLSPVDIMEEQLTIVSGASSYSVLNCTE